MLETSTEAILEPGEETPTRSPRGARAYDVRARQEILHRRQFQSVVRRILRVAGLHAVDGIWVLGIALLLSGDTMGEPALRVFVPATVAVFLLSLNAASAYNAGDGRRDLHRLGWGVALASLILGCLAVFPPHLPLDMSLLGRLAALTFVGLAIGRKLVDLLVRQVYLHGIGLRRAVLIGTLDEVSSAIQQLRDDQNADQYLIGHLSPGGQDDPTAMGALRDLPKVLDEADVQEVIVATPLPARALREVAERCFDRGIVLFIFPSSVGPIDCQVEPVRVGRVPMLHVFPQKLRVPSLIAKRVFDWVFAAAMLIVAAPLMLVIAIAIKIDSEGPVFFRQTRIGKNGRPFRIWKFRSMSRDAEAVKLRLAHLNAYGDPRLFKMADDPRVTRVGRLLRRTSLDELPQLFNVVAGEMSLVGPRPPLPAEVERYEPHHLIRLAVVPGITGPWQVNGRNLITDFEEVVRLERDYISSWSIGADIRILLRTLPVVVTGEGAY